MILSPLRVAQFAYDAGFRGKGLAVIVAIAHAESGLNDQAIGDVALETDVWGPSVGLWQIRTLKNPHSVDRDINWLLQPSYLDAHQAESAFHISHQGTDFSPWSTYINGAYIKFLPEARQAIATMEGQQMPNGPSTIITMVPTPTGGGYWILFSDGAVFGFGDAGYFGRPVLDSNGVWQAEK